MKTKRDIRITFRDLHDILIPSGTRATKIAGPNGGWIVEPGAVRLLSDTAAIFKHDSTYYYIWVQEADLEPTLTIAR